MKVLSLFDGMSGGRMALERANIKVDKYFSSEIDKYAIQIADKNYPEDTPNRLGSIINLTEEQLLALGDIDLILGGFPCQSYSVGGKREGINSKNGQLIYEVFRVLSIVKPKSFMLENVKGLISIDKGETFKHILQELNNVGYAVDFRLINSALVSAQNRERVFILGQSLKVCKGSEYNLPHSKEMVKATLKETLTKNVINDYQKQTTQGRIGSDNIIMFNSGLTQPKDKGVLLRDILEDGVVDREKSYCIDANYARGGNLKQYFEKSRRQLVFEEIPYEHSSYRKLTPRECEALQTVKKDYTEGVSNSQRYKMLGNGWTIDVIAHILKNIKGYKNV